MSAIRQFIRAHPGKALLVAIAAVLYITFNVWFFRYAKSGGATSPSAIWQTVIKSTTSFPGLTGLNPVKKQGSTLTEQSPSPPPTPTPTPRPTGPGDYACDPYGQCNLYSDVMRKQYCTVTYADSLCLDQCGEKTKQCQK